MRRTLAAMATAAAIAAAATGNPAGQSRTAAPPPASTRADMAVPFRVGEVLTFDVAYSTYLVAGTATSTVVEKRAADNSTAYFIVAEGRPLPLIERIYALYYKMDTMLDSVSG